VRSLALFLAAAVACLTACATSPGRTASQTGSMAATREPRGQWVLDSVVDKGRQTIVPTSLDVYLIFGKNDEIRGFDGCAHYDGRLHRSADGSMKAVEVGITANGCGSLGVALDAARGEIDIVFYRSRPITVSERDNRLTIATTGHSLTYVPRSAVGAVATAFRRLSGANGEPSPHDAAYVITTYKRADELLGHNRSLGRDGHEKVYLIVARGTFVGHDSRTSQRSTLYAAYNDNAALWEWGIRPTRPHLSELGTVVPLRL
jgi:hypothetical protein